MNRMALGERCHGPEFAATKQGAEAIGAWCSVSQVPAAISPSCLRYQRHPLQSLIADAIGPLRYQEYARPSNRTCLLPPQQVRALVCHEINVQHAHARIQTPQGPQVRQVPEKAAKSEATGFKFTLTLELRVGRILRPRPPVAAAGYSRTHLRARSRM